MTNRPTVQTNSPKSPPLLGVVLNRVNSIKPTPQKPIMKFKRRANVVWNKKQTLSADGICKLINAAAYCQTPPPTEMITPEADTKALEYLSNAADKISVDLVNPVNYKFVFFPPTKKFFWISVNEVRRHEIYERSTVRELYELKNGQQIKLYYYTCLKRGAETFCKNCSNRHKSHLKCLATKEVWVWHPAVNSASSTCLES